MIFGLSKEQNILLSKAVIEPLKDMGFQVYIFGSRTSGKHHPFSDIDILFEGNSSQDLKNKINAIKEQMQESNFPFKVDLVYLPDLAESYKASVLKNRVLL